MRRIYKFDDYDIGAGPYVTIHKRDYRLLLAVARAMSAYRKEATVRNLLAACGAIDKLNAEVKGRM